MQHERIVQEQVNSNYPDPDWLTDVFDLLFTNKLIAKRQLGLDLIKGCFRNTDATRIVLLTGSSSAVQRRRALGDLFGRRERHQANRGAVHQFIVRKRGARAPQSIDAQDLDAVHGEVFLYPGRAAVADNIGAAVETARDFEKAFGEAMRFDGPAMIEVRIDPEAITPVTTITKMREQAMASNG